MTRLLPLDAATYEPHRLHRGERIWGETNCYVDIWIEVLHALGLEPMAASAFAVSSDFEGDQWTFFKFPPEDLRALYGIEVFEMNPWRPLLDHVIEHLEQGRLITLEADAWYLPDTRGVSYRVDHTKTTIVPNSVDAQERRLGYFHNAAYFELVGEDFDGVFRLGATAQAGTLPPYAETIRLDRLDRLDPADLVAASRERLAAHVRLMPASNPIPRFRGRLEADLDWLRSAGLDGFHQYAFATCRQCGASAEVAADYLTWLAPQEPDARRDLDRASDAFRSIARDNKALEFSLARLAHGRRTDVMSTFDGMIENWENARDVLVDRYGA